MKRHATPLEDTAEDVVKRALDALDEARAPARAATAIGPAPIEGVLDPTGEDTVAAAKLPQKAFRRPLLETLCELGGAGSTRDIREAMLRKIAPLLGPLDYAAVTSGDPRWWNAVCWERNALIGEGTMRRDSPRGRWELTDQGIQSFGAAHEFAFNRDFPVSIEGRVFQFLKGQSIPAAHFPRAVREKWPIEPAQPPA